MSKVLIGTSPIIGPIYGVDDAPRNGNGGGVPPSSYLAGFHSRLIALPGDAEFHEAQPVILAASARRQEVVSYQVQAGRLAMVRGLAFGCRLLSDFDNVTWAVLVDGATVSGLDSICGPFGAFLHPNIKPTLIPLSPGQRVVIVASNATAVAIPDVTGYLHGHHWPEGA